MKQIMLGIVFVVLCSPAFAWNNHENDPYKRNGDPNYRYQGSTGTQYQYDLSKPSDQVRYDIDLKAQMRDQLSVDPRRALDQGVGKYGGGISR